MKKIILMLLVILAFTLLCSCSSEDDNIPSLDYNITLFEYKNEVTFTEFENTFDNVIENSFLTNLEQYDFYFKMIKSFKTTYLKEDSDETNIEEKSRILETQYDFENQIIRQISVDPEYEKKSYDVTLFSNNSKYYESRKDGKLTEMEESLYLRTYNHFIAEVENEIYSSRTHNISGSLYYIDDNIYTVILTQPYFSKIIHQYVINEKSITLYYFIELFNPTYNVSHSEEITTCKVELISIDLKKDLN